MYKLFCTFFADQISYKTYTKFVYNLRTFFDLSFLYIKFCANNVQIRLYFLCTSNLLQFFCHFFAQFLYSFLLDFLYKDYCTNNVKIILHFYCTLFFLQILCRYLFRFFVKKLVTFLTQIFCTQNLYIFCTFFAQCGS